MNGFREAEVPDEIVMRYKVRENFFIAMVILLSAFHLDSHYLLCLHFDGGDHSRPVP